MVFTLVGVLAGCGTNNDNGASFGMNGTNTTNTISTTDANNTIASPSNTTVTNNTAMITTNASTPVTNTTGTKATNTQSPALASVSIPLAATTAQPTINIKIPANWTKSRVGAGDTTGYAWANPENAQEQILVMISGNLGAVKNSKGQWDVTGIFGAGKSGITWSSVSSNKQDGQFIDSTNFIPLVTDHTTNYTGYGKAIIAMKPTPQTVAVEIWAPQNIANAVLPTVHLQP